MQINEKIYRIFILMTILGLLILSFTGIVSNNHVFVQIFAQNLHDRTLDEITKPTYGFKKTAHIDVGDSPITIAINGRTSIVYVVNTDSSTVSVISGKNNTKMGEDIPVGNKPIAIDIDYTTKNAYIINSYTTITDYLSTSENGTVSVISGKNHEKMGEDIPVGNMPRAIAVNEPTDTVYVTNTGSNTVSVIKNNAKMGEDIPVGNKPIGIDINEETNTVYVVNTGSSTVSVIKNNAKMGEDIPVGNKPTAIDVNVGANTVYVANTGSSTVSVIKNNAKMGEDIPVGNKPTAIDSYEKTNTVYVANTGSSSVSVIDGISNKVVAGITLQVNPFNSGYIECNRLKSPISQNFYVFDKTECIAKSNQGFHFLSWEENLKDKSTQVISISRPVSILESIKNFFNIESEEPEAKLKITKFGSFTANFKELPPPVPPEFWLQSYILVGTVIAGLSIPSIVGWIKSKMDARKLKYYHKKIASLYEDDGKLDENDIEPLNRLRSSILNAYSDGNLIEKHYESLKNETTLLYEKIFRNRINDSLNNDNYPVNKKSVEKQLAEVRSEIENAYSEGKLNEKHYINLVNNISILYQEVFKKEFESLYNLPNNEDQIKLLNKLYYDIEDAYSKEKITEKHYNLLKEKMSEFENKNKDNERI